MASALLYRGNKPYVISETIHCAIVIHVESGTDQDLRRAGAEIWNWDDRRTVSEEIAGRD